MSDMKLVYSNLTGRGSLLLSRMLGGTGDDSRKGVSEYRSVEEAVDG